MWPGHRIVTALAAGAVVMAVSPAAAWSTPGRAGGGDKAAWASLLAGESRTVLRDCSKIETPRPRVKPERMDCGTVGAPAFRDVTWSKWGGGIAQGAGRLIYRYCESGVGCADPANYHEAPTTVWAYRLRRCDGRRAYTRLRAAFIDLHGEANGYRLSLDDAWSDCKPLAASSRRYRHCNRVKFTPNSGDAFVRIRARGTGCGAARRTLRSFRDVGWRQQGWRCHTVRRYAVGNERLSCHPIGSRRPTISFDTGL